MRLRLIPRTGEFYDLFAQAGVNALEVARTVEARFREFPNTSITQDQVKNLEHEGDRLTHEVVLLLNTQYVTPFDREDIYELATALDDVVDYLDEASDLLELYAVESPARHAIEPCRILVTAIVPLADALRELKGFKAVQENIVRVKSLEDEGDRVVRGAIAELFQDSRIDPLLVIRWKDIFEALERALDACDRAARVLGNIVVKNT